MLKTLCKYFIITYTEIITELYNIYNVLQYKSNNKKERLLTTNCRCHYHSGSKSRLIGKIKRNFFKRSKFVNIYKYLTLM